MDLPARPSDWFEPLHAAARAQSGLSDFGHTDYQAGMRVLLQSLDCRSSAGQLAKTGGPYMFGMMVGALIARLYTEEGWRRHPAYRDVQIRRPLVIIGIPRTGTTALHKLLSVDPQFQGAERWLSGTPMPRPSREKWASMPEFQTCEAGLAAFFAAAPAMAAAHDMTAGSVDECLDILCQSFVSNMFASSFDVPEYRDWWYAQDEGPSYRRYADVLRLIGLNEPDKRWLLKNPGHIWGIEHLFEVFPDACVVQTHRDPAKSIPSLSSVLEMSHGICHGEHADPTRIGPVECDKWLRAAQRTSAFRDRHPDQFHDVRHVDFHRDPLGIVRGIYQRFDITLDSDTEARMQRWLDEQPAEQKGTHRYTAEHFGLTEAGIREQYADYRARYGV